MKPIIEVNHLTKEYQLGHITSLKENVFNTFRRLGGKPIQQRENFKALDDVSFTIEEGEVVGIIGHNGAGKSTLLKHLANISKPTKGKVVVRGSVAPLIEVGAGVNPELTGRENIFLNGAILGIPKKIIQQKLDEIIDFSELEQFIDTPVKRYSSGMTVKLGFSIATSMDADILIVDEVLSVGDLAFQRKCITRMEGLIKSDGKTVLLVSHNIRQLERICSRIIILDHGRISFDGNSSEGCNLFYEVNNVRVHQYAKQEAITRTHVITSEEIEVADIHLFANDDVTPTDSIEMHEKMRIRVQYHANVDLPEVEMVVGIHTTDFVYIASTGTAVLSQCPRLEKGTHSFECVLNDVVLYPGIYAIRLAFLDQYSRPIWYGESLTTFRVTSNRVNRAKMPNLGLVDLPFTWDLHLSGESGAVEVEHKNTNSQEMVTKSSRFAK
jgi:ABC-type polysaccharide/polyol phosphate transport system ATPase subunit